MRTLLLFLACSLLFAYNSENSTNDTAKDNSTTIAATNTIKKKDACQYLERDTMSKILNWNHGNINESLLESAANGKKTVCSFKHQDDILQLRVAWEEASAPTDYVLVKKYAEYLEKGDEGVDYRVTKGGANSQTIFGIGKTPDQLHRYIMRRRIGNTTDIELTMTTTKNMPAEFRTRLLRLMDAIDLK